MILKDLLAGLEYTCEGPTDVEIEDVACDSRNVKKGSLFVCLCGSSVDSHRFAEQAAQAGAAAIVAQKPVAHGNAALVMVEDTRAALASISAAWFGHPAERMTVVGITGTKGKTTTSYMIRSILEAGGIKTGIIGTIGAVIGDTVIATDNTTPGAYDVQRYLRMMADAGCKAAVLEASSIGLRDHRVDGFEFDYGLFTNFSPDHIGGKEHKDVNEYMQCKSMLFRRCKTGIFNVDDENWQGVAQGHTCSVETYGFSKNAELRASGEQLISRPGYLGVHFEMDGPRGLRRRRAYPGPVQRLQRACRDCGLPAFSGDGRSRSQGARYGKGQGSGGAGPGSRKLYAADRLCPQRSQHGKYPHDAARVSSPPPCVPVRRGRQPGPCPPLRDG